MAAGVLSVMCANNLVNGVYVCENNHTTNHILREYGGFKGWMCSDYRVRQQLFFDFHLSQACLGKSSQSPFTC